MPRLPVISGKDMMKFLEKEGFIHTRSKGSHRVYVKTIVDHKLITVIPDHKELEIKTLKSILRQSHISEEQFIEHYT